MPGISRTGVAATRERKFQGLGERLSVEIQASPDPKIVARISDPQQWNKYSYVRNSPFVYVDPDGRDLHIVVTNFVVGESYVNRYTASEIRNNPRLAQEQEKVPTYRVTFSNDSGSNYEAIVTRDSNRNGPTSKTRGDYGSGNEAPPGVYAGAVRDDGALGYRIEVRDAKDSTSAIIAGPDGQRSYIQMHIGPGCSEGCMLLTGGQPGRDEFQKQVKALINEDIKNENGSAISIIIVNRNVPLMSDGD